MLELDHSKVQLTTENHKTFENKRPDVSSSSRSKISAELAVFLINARTLVKHGENHLALNLLREATNKDSKNPEVLKLMASLLEKEGRYEEAYKVFCALYNQNCIFEFAFKKAQMSYLIQNEEKALQEYYEALSHLETDRQELFEVYKNMGNIFVRLGDFESADESYNKAFTIKPQSDALLVNMGTLEMQKEDYDKSLMRYRCAVELNPSNDKAWVGLAIIHRHFSDVELAWGNLVKAIDINPYNKTALQMMSLWSSLPEKQNFLKEKFEYFLEKNADDLDVSLLLLKIYLELKMDEQFSFDLLKLRLLHSENSEIQRLYEHYNKEGVTA